LEARRNPNTNMKNTGGEFENSGKTKSRESEG
jgi:hypothetical protein